MLEYIRLCHLLRVLRLFAVIYIDNNSCLPSRKKKIEVDKKMFLRTVALAVIDKEILQGNDELSLSTSFLLNELPLMGYETQKISVLPEDAESIAIEIQHLSKAYDVVIVVEKLDTYYAHHALGILFHCERQLHSRFTDCLNRRSGTWISLTRKDLFLPPAAKILARDVTYPVVFIQRIFVMKAEYVPEQFSKSLRNHLFYYRKEKQARKRLVMRKNAALSSLEKLPPNENDIRIIYDQGAVYATLEVISLKIDTLNKFVDEFTVKYNSDIITMYVPPLDSSAPLADDDSNIKSAINDIQRCFDTYGPENCFMAFNGGKDCTVLLDLLNSVLRINYSDHNQPIHCLYVQSEHPFPEQDDFLVQCEKYYGLKVRTVQSGIKDALAEMLKENVHLKACLMGTRRTDPYSSNLSVFQMTDPDWPQIMRVNPLLNWHHSDIWDYLIYYKVFYCTLYDEGYTSLGSVNNTTKNSSLSYYNLCNDKDDFLPAYKLFDELKERSGRI